MLGLCSRLHGRTRVLSPGNWLDLGPVGQKLRVGVDAHLTVCWILAGAASVSVAWTLLPASWSSGARYLSRSSFTPDPRRGIWTRSTAWLWPAGHTCRTGRDQALSLPPHPDLPPSVLTRAPGRSAPVNCPSPLYL